VLVAALAARAALRNPAFADSGTLFAVTARDQPESAQAHLLLAAHLMGEERWTAAQDALDRAAAIAPGYLPIPYRQARCARRLGRLEEALAHLERARALDPTDADVPLLAAHCHLDRGDRAAAAAAVERAGALARAPAWRDAAAAALRARGAGGLAERLAGERR